MKNQLNGLVVSFIMNIRQCFGILGHFCIYLTIALIVVSIVGPVISTQVIQNEATAIHLKSKDINDTAVKMAERLFYIKIHGSTPDKYIMFCAKNPIKGFIPGYWISCGTCGDVSNTFRLMMDFLKIPARSVGTSGEDHEWNEFLLNGTWVHIDASADDIPKLNDSGIYYRPRGDNGGWGKNISYVYGIYSNGTRIDLTSNYVPHSKIGNITVMVTDRSQLPIPGVTINFKSKFLMFDNKTNKPLVSTSCVTDYQGKCTVALGQNNFTVSAEHMCLPILEYPCIFTAKKDIFLDGNSSQVLRLSLAK